MRAAGLTTAGVVGVTMAAHRLNGAPLDRGWAVKAVLLVALAVGYLDAAALTQALVRVLPDPDPARPLHRDGAGLGLPTALTGLAVALFPFTTGLFVGGPQELLAWWLGPQLPFAVPLAAIGAGLAVGANETVAWRWERRNGARLVAVRDNLLWARPAPM